MPQINSDGTITIPIGIVRNMEGKPGDEIVFEEWLEPYIINSDKSINALKTLEVSVMLRSEWDKELENKALPLRKLEPPRSEHEICSEIESRIGIDLLSTDVCSVDSVFRSIRRLEDREWLCGVYFALSQCFTDNRSLRILGELKNYVNPSSVLRKKQVREIIERLLV